MASSPGVSEVRREPGQPFVGDFRYPDLAVLALGRVRPGAGQPVEHGALAGARKTRNAYLHGDQLSVDSGQ